MLGVLRRIAQVVSADAMPDAIEYDAAAQRLRVGRGWIEPVPPAVCRYEVSGKQVLVRWFSHRRRTRTHPVIGDRRPPSPLGDIQPAGWPEEYTSELLNVLNVHGLLVDLGPRQAAMLERVCTGPLPTLTGLMGANALPGARRPAAVAAADETRGRLFGDEH